jgi:hypothetical protein
MTAIGFETGRGPEHFCEPREALYPFYGFSRQASVCYAEISDTIGPSVPIA